MIVRESDNNKLIYQSPIMAVTKHVGPHKIKNTKKNSLVPTNVPTRFLILNMTRTVSLQKPLNDKAWFVAEEKNASVLTPSLSFLDGTTSSNSSDSECRRKMAKQISRCAVPVEFVVIVSFHGVSRSVHIDTVKTAEFSVHSTRLCTLQFIDRFVFC